MELNITRRHPRTLIYLLKKSNVVKFENQLDPGAAPTQKRALEDNE